MTIILYVSSEYDDDDDDDDVNCERRYWNVEVVLALNEQTKRFKFTWKSNPDLCDEWGQRSIQLR